MQLVGICGIGVQLHQERMALAHHVFFCVGFHLQRHHHAGLVRKLPPFQFLQILDQPHRFGDVCDSLAYTQAT